MTPWWSEQAGGWIGAAMGISGGVIGALCGTIRGMRSRTFVDLGAGAGGIAAIAGGIALATGQPYHVWYPLMLWGGILLSVMIGLAVLLRKLEAQRDRTRLGAEELRRGG